MADNIDVTPGSGKTVATDDVSGVQFQKIKIDVGADGVSAPLSATDTVPTTIYSSGTEVDFTAPVEVLGTGTAGTPATGVVTVQGVASMTPVQVSQATAANLNATVVGSVASGATDAGNPVKVGGRYNSTYPTLTNGQRGDMQLTAGGALVTAMGSYSVTATDTLFPNYNASVVARVDIQGNEGGPLLAANVLFGASSQKMQKDINGAISTAASGDGIVAVEQAGATFRNINSATTTQVKGAAGILHKVIVNAPVASATISIYNATSGTTNPVAVITCPATVTNPFELSYELYCSTGIRVITSGATDVTVVYR